MPNPQRTSFSCLHVFCLFCFLLLPTEECFLCECDGNSLWGGSVVNLGTQKHRDKYLEGISTLRYPGCFAMTELHHGRPSFATLNTPFSSNWRNLSGILCLDCCILTFTEWDASRKLQSWIYSSYSHHMGCHQGPMCKESRQQQLLIACLMNLSLIPPMKERPNGGSEMQLFMESLPQCLPGCACHLQTLILTLTWVFMPSLFQYVPLKIMQFCLELRFVIVATKWDWMGWITGPSGSMMFEFQERIC